MSAIHGLNPAPLRTPEPPRPAVESPAPPARHSAWGAWALIAIVCVGAWGAYRFFTRTKPQNENSQAVTIRTAKVTNGPIERVLRLTGSTTAKQFATVAAPMMRGPDSGRALILIYVANSGGHVKKGDIVARIDAQSMIDHVADIAATIQQADADIRRRKAEQAMSWENTQQDLRVAKAEWDKAKLDAAAAEIRTPIDAEILKLDVEEAEATYQEKLVDLPKEKVSNAAELRILDLTKMRHTRHHDRHATDVERFTIHAPIDGLVVMQSIWRGTEMGQVQQGDQVAPGQPFMKIVDTSSMQMQARASQVETDEIRLGQPAIVSFDAFPDLKLKARVSSLGAIATAGMIANNFLRTVPVYLTILDHDSRVIPDLSTAANVVVDRADASALAPLEAIETKDGKSFVHVKTPGGFETREVKLGVRDNIHTAVLEGLRAGDEIALGPVAPGPVLASN